MIGACFLSQWFLQDIFWLLFLAWGQCLFEVCIHHEASATGFVGAYHCSVEFSLRLMFEDWGRHQHTKQTITKDDFAGEPIIIHTIYHLSIHPE